MNRPLHLLLLCTGNSCRSQMAEGWARHLAARWPEPWLEVASAGIEAHGKNPRAIAAMAEAGVDIGAQASTRLTPEMLDWADVVVTVCGHADEHCPALPPGVEKRHWPLEDPARATGDEPAVAAVFRASRDDIRARVGDLLAGLRRRWEEGAR